MAVGLRLYHKCQSKDTQPASCCVLYSCGDKQSAIMEFTSHCVEIDRRIETMVQRFEDSVVSLIDYLSGLSYLVCASETDS